MAVYVSNGDLTLSTSGSGWLRSEEYQLITHNTNTNNRATLSSTVLHTQILSFANNCNCSGAILWFCNNTTASNLSVVVRLQEALSPVTFDVTLDTVTYASHGLSNGTEVSFTSTGTLPGGITANQVYYVINATTNDFQISATAGGSAINLTGTPSGTATCWAVRGKSTKTASDLASNYGSAPFRLAAAYYFGWTPYAVDTTSNKWRLGIRAESVVSNGMAILYQDSGLTILGRIMVTDYATGKPSSSDTAVIKDTVTMDEDWSLGFTEQVSGYPLSMLIPVGGKFQLENPPSNKYTLTINGFIEVAGGTFQAGTEASPISPSNQFNITFTRLGHSGITGFYIYNANEVTVRKYGIGRIYLHGTAPVQYGYLASKANANQKNLVLTEDLSSYISAGDTLRILGGQAVSGGGSVATEVRTVSSVSGTTVTVTSNLTYAHDAGWAVIIDKSSLYGIVINHAAGLNLTAFPQIDIKMTGVYWSTGGYTWTVQNVSYTSWIRAYRVFRQCFFGLINFSWVSIWNDLVSTEFTDCIIRTNLNYDTHNFSVNGVTMTRCFFFDNFAQNGNTMYAGTNWKLTGCQVSGCSVGATSANVIAGSTNMEVTNCRFIQCGHIFGGAHYGLRVNNCLFDCITTDGAVANFSGGVDCIFNNCTIATNGGSTNFHKINQYVYTRDIIYKDPTGATTPPLTYQADLVAGSNIRFHNSSSNQHYVYKREGIIISTGSGLSDTTVHSAGGYAMRFQPTSSTENLKWDFYVPIGNIQGYTMSVKVWVKINSATYYAGTHQKPKLTVDYDNGTTTSATATGTTDWQQLSVSFTPTTTYGQITVSIEGATDATGSNAYFYVDDLDLVYPSGYAYNLGMFDLWANALPITPASDNTGILSYDWSEDPYVNITEAQAAALTGISLNYTNKTMTVTSDHTILELYEYAKQSARSLKVLYPFSTKDGVTYKLSGGWTFIPSSNVDITGVGNFDLNTTSFTVPSGFSSTAYMTDGKLIFNTAGTYAINFSSLFGSITADFTADGTYDLTGCDIQGTLILDTSNNKTVTVKLAPNLNFDNKKPSYITVENARTVVVKVSGLVAGSTVRVWETVSGTELINEVATGTSVQTNYVYTEDIAISVRVRKASSGTKYLEWNGAGTITTSGANVAVVQIEDKNIEATSPTATGWSIDTDTKLISVSGGTIDTLTTNELYTWLQDQMDTTDNMSIDNPMTCNVLATSYTLENGWKLDTNVEKYLKTGGISTSDGNDVYTNVVSVGSLVSGSQVYVKQNGAKLTSWWSTGNIDILIKVKSGGSEIDNGMLYFYIRKFNNFYEYVELDASAGGRQVIALTNTTDPDNATASGTVASWNDITITWGAVNKDLQDGLGECPYDVVIDCAGRPVSQVYEYLKYVVREGETTEQNGVDGELYLRADDDYPILKTAPFGTFAGGKFFGARGVWIENMASSDIQNFQLIDTNGTTHIPPAYITISNIVNGSRIQLYNVSTNTEIANEIVSGTTYQKIYSPATGGEDIRVRLTYVTADTAYLFYEGHLTTTTLGGSHTANQVEDETYEANAIDGSTVTECSVSGTTIKIFIDDPDNTTTVQRIYNWYCYMLFTESGIRDQGWYLRAIDSTSYKAYSGLLINNQSENPLLLDGGYIVPSTGGSVIDIYDTTGNPIFLGYNHAVLAENATKGEIADAVWDEAVSGHNTAGTFGEKLKKQPFYIDQSGLIIKK